MKNPPAFPRPFSWDTSPSGCTMGDREEPHVQQEGMSLRQWYAGKALTGMLASEHGEETYRYDDAAARAFGMADAMLKRETQNTNALNTAGHAVRLATIDALREAYHALDRTSATLPYTDFCAEPMDKIVTAAKLIGVDGSEIAADWGFKEDEE